MITKIEVTQDDIDNGKKGACCECPIALAIMRIVKEVTVGTDNADFYKWNQDQLARIISRELPQSAKNFIYTFDKGFKVKPFAFPLDIPDECLK